MTINLAQYNIALLDLTIYRPTGHVVSQVCFGHVSGLGSMSGFPFLSSTKVA